MKKSFIIFLAAAATLCACNKEEVSAPSVSDNARVVKFTTQNLYSFDTKAMAQNEKISVFAGSPITDATNKPYTITALPGAESGTLSGTGILWGIEQMGTDNPAPFYAIYPYESDGRSSFAVGTNLAWTISSAANVGYAADVLVAYTTAAPGAGEEKLVSPDPVALAFEHPFSLLEYTITNNSDDSIKEVAISQVPNDGYLVFGSALTAPKEVESVIVLGEEKLNLVDGKYQGVIFPANGISPRITITMWSGATATYNVATPTNFEKGKKYSASITYTHSHSEAASQRNPTIEFTATEDWTTGSMTAPGSQEEVVGISDSAWPGIRGANIQVGDDTPSWDQSVSMKCIGENLFEATITKVAEGNMEFKVYVKSTNTWYGKGGEEDGAGSWAGWKKMTAGSGNVVWGESSATVRFDGTNIYVQ